MAHKLLSVITILFLFSVIIPGNAQLDDDSIDALEAKEARENREKPEISPQSTTYTYSRTGLEVGGLLGIPSGFTMRYWFSDRYGMEILSGFSLDSEPLIAADFLYQPFGMFHAGTWNFYLTIGAGLMLSYIKNDPEYITRFPIGVTLPLDNYPVQFTLYGAPAIVINKSMKNELQWGVAVTYSFSRGEYLFEKRQQAIYRNWKLQGEVEGLKTGLSETKGKLSQTETDLEKTRGKLSETEHELNKITGELDTTRSKILMLENTLSSTKGELETAKTSLGKVKTDLDTAKDQLSRTQVRLNEKERELQQNQDALDKAKIIIQTALEGKEREEEEKKITQKQIQLNKEVKRLAEEKLSLKKGNEQEVKVRALWEDQCSKRRGIVNSEGECVCRVGETWDAKKNACVCIKGYTLNRKTNICEPCPIVNVSGSCVSKCAEDENRIAMKSGPHKFVCVKKCRGKNEIWIKSSNKCGCIEGYNYDKFEKCVPRR